MLFNPFVLILIWLGYMAFIQMGAYGEEYNELTGQNEYRVKLLFAFIVMIPLIWVAAVRDNSFGDTVVYRHNFNLMPESFLGIPEYMLTVTKDKGFSVLSLLIKIIIGNHDKVYFGLIALLQSVGLILIFRRYSFNYVFSVFLFVASSDYAAWMHNGLRQFTAVTIILLAIPLILKKKYIPSLILILIASTMHQSALLMIPIAIICQGEAWNIKTLLMIIALVLAITSINQFTDLLNDSLSNTQYSNVVRDYRDMNDDGTNPIRVLFYSIPTILAFIKRRDIRGINDQLINFSVNMSITSTALYIISMFTSGIFIGRLPIYASLFNYILLPWELITFFKNTRLVIAITVSAYLVFFYYQMHMAWGIL